jgi:hypothetical protein
MTTIQSTGGRSKAAATSQNFGRCLGLLVLATLGVWSNAAQGVQYDFLSVTGNNIPGNLASTTFTSDYLNGSIGVTHQFTTPAAAGALDNNNGAIFPSQFLATFPGTGQVQGHLAMTVYGYQSTPGPGDPSGPYTSKVIFDLTPYLGSLPDLVFGLWNTTDEVALPAYNIQLLDATNTLVPPTSFLLINNQDNETQVAGKHMMQLNTATGDITAPTLINNGGTHTDAMFFKGIPTGTQQIIVTANLPFPLNNIGDGVGYYFAEIVVPEPSSCALLSIGLVAFAMRGRRGR